MKHQLSVKFIVLTLTLLVGSLAVTATERPFSLNGTALHKKSLSLRQQA